MGNVQDSYVVRYYGCAYQIGNLWRIAMRDDLGPQDDRCTLRHEYGHVNGWPANHPGARYV